MANLDELVKMRGVVLAFEFSPEGKLKSFKASEDITQDMAAMAAQYCATVTMTFATLSQAFTKLSQMAWTPQRGWTYTGGDYTVIMGDNGFTGVFVRTSQADLPQLTQTLIRYK